MSKAVVRYGVRGALVALAMMAGTCGPKKDESGSVKAFRASHRSQLIGGPAALAEVGDFILENDEIRVAILQPGNSVGPGIFGGTLIDADLNRPQAEYQGGHGEDQFAEIFPSMNLLIPNPPPGAVRRGPDWDGPPAPPPKDACPAVWPKDDQGNPLARDDFSVICASGPGDDYLEAMGILGLIIGEASFQTDYVLRRGARYVEMVTTVAAGEGSRDQVRPMCPFRQRESSADEPKGVLDAIVGDDNYTSGMLAGDFLMFGKRLKVFAPNLGFDETSHIMDKFMHGEDILNHPVSYDFMVGVGDKVSYGVVTDRRPAEDPWGICGPADEAPGKLLVPIETGAFTFVFHHWWRCPTSDPDCQSGGRLSYRRYFIIGEGDTASVLDEALKIWGVPSGRIKGHVYDSLTGKPVSHAKVFVIKDPLDPQFADEYPRLETTACDLLRADGRVVSYDLLERCAKAASVSDQFPVGRIGVINEILTDRGDDRVWDGNFSAHLQPGRYYVVAYKSGHRPSDAQRIEVKAGKTFEVGIPIGPAGRVQFDIRDQAGHRTAAKITVVGDCFDAKGRDVCNCFPVTDPSCRGDGIPDSGKTYLELGDSRFKMGIVKVIHSATGAGEFTLAPGRYRFVISKGGEYSIDEQVLTLPDDGRAQVLDGEIQRVVDSTGWISGDFHVHGQNSFDAVVRFKDRITSYLVEGIELLSSSDHDWITDYGPIARRMGVDRWIKTQVGLELTTVEIGHFIGFPLHFDDNLPENGAVDWRGLPPRQIFTALRNLGEYGPQNTVVLVPHPRDSFFGYFDQFGMNPYDLTLEPGLLQTQNSILANSANFDPTQDAIEVINGKRYDMIRTPSNDEIRKFNTCIAYLRHEIDALPDDFAPEECKADWSEDQASEYWVRRVLARSPQESKAFGYYKDAARQCLSDVDCQFLGDSAYCNRNLGRCRMQASCHDNSDCDLGDCDNETGLCKLDAECDPAHRDECGADLVCDPVLGRCVEPCKHQSDCHPSAACCMDAACGCKDSACGQGKGVCVEASCQPSATWEVTGEGADRPCVEWQGVAEDWFRLLNHGIVYTAMGNSDSHTLTRIEGGMPHNFVCSSTDDPAEIDPLEIARNIKAHCSFLSYGPFMEFWVDGKPMGSQLNVPAGQPLDIRVRVQSPAWFDVDRVEVYRNGSLRWVFLGNEQGDQCQGAMASWPCRDIDVGDDFVTRECHCIPTANGHNTNVVNLDVTFQDNPDQDAWYSIIAMGVGPNARTESPIYTPVYYPEMSFGLVVNAAFSNFDIGIDLSEYIKPIPQTPQVSPILPYAVSNPIWVDRDADMASFRFDPPGGPPSWLMNAADTHMETFPFSSQSATFRRLSKLSSSHVRSLSMNKIRAFFVRGLRGALRREVTGRIQTNALKRMAR